MRKYKNKYNLFYFNDCASIKTSFGCPEKCTFCFCRKMNQEEYGRRPLASVLQEIESIPNKNVFIVDDNFLLSPTYLEAFCESIKEKKITKQFIVYGTSRFIANHPELMKKLREAGLLAILVGLEFISDEALNAVHKGSDYADNETCIRVCQELDIELIGLFMLDPNWPASEFKNL
ncbi:MAG: radical SAM protein [Saprospiraceae bacterium]|nr:radical SAM protein [Saprospiraceae bacterium]